MLGFLEAAHGVFEEKDRSGALFSSAFGITDLVFPDGVCRGRSIRADEASLSLAIQRTLTIVLLGRTCCDRGCRHD